MARPSFVPHLLPRLARPYTVRTRSPTRWGSHHDVSARGHTHDLERLARGADDAGVVLQHRPYDGSIELQQRQELLGVVADAAADDDHLRPRRQRRRR